MSEPAEQPSDRIVHFASQRQLLIVGLRTCASDAARDWQGADGAKEYIRGQYDAYHRVLGSLGDDSLPERIEDCR